MKRILLVTILVLNVLWANAESTIRVEVPNVVAVNEQFNLTFIVEGDKAPSDFNWNTSEDFQLVWGPQQGSSRSVQIINGKRTSSSQFTYTYILIPKKSGKFNIPAATAKLKKSEITSKSPIVEVVANGSSSTSSSSSSSGTSNPSVSGQISDNDIFLKFTINRTNVVLGEPIIATLKLYQRVNIAGFEDAKFPEFNGFWSQEVETPSNIEFKRESYNDMIYNTAVIRKYMLIPQQVGTIKIDPAELVCLINIKVNSGGGSSIFDGFFDDYRTIRKRVVSQAYNINVGALPSGAPSTFGGGVGEFSISAKLSTDSLKAHEAASLVLTVSGRGNVSLLEAPKPVFPPDVEVYDTKISEKMSPSSGGTSGSKIYEFPFIPRSHGDFVMAPVKYSYYDVSKKKYITLETQPLEFKVAKGEEISSPATVPTIAALGQKGVKNLGEDIRFIKTGLPKLSSKGDFIVTKTFFYAIIGLILVLAGLIWALFRKFAARQADVVGAKTRKATKMALKRLKLANDFLNKNLYSAFYEELHKALLGYIGDKLNIAVADLSKDNISSVLKNLDVNEGLIKEFTDIIDACEFARYSPVSSQDAMAVHYNAAVNSISILDSNMKANKKSKSGVATAIVILLLSVTGVSEVKANNDYADSLWTSATTAYTKGEWTQAIKDYSSITELGLESPELYTNLANAFYKNSNITSAILNYERALKLDPSYEDAKYNLEICSYQIQDRIDVVPEFLIKAWMRMLSYSLDSNTWAIIFLVLLTISLAAILVFFLSSSSVPRKLGFFTSITVFILSIFAISFAISQKNDYQTQNTAIIMESVSSVKSSPSSGESSKDLFILHEGTKVTILDSVGDWNNVELADGRRGWLPAGDLEVI